MTKKTPETVKTHDGVVCLVILGFHSRDQQPCFLTETKKRICIKIEFNSRRVNWGSNMAVASLFRGSNMTAVTPGENQE